MQNHDEEISDVELTADSPVFRDLMAATASDEGATSEIVEECKAMKHGKDAKEKAEIMQALGTYLRGLKMVVI